MTAGSYNQFCPIAMAAEILCSRWTVLLLREIMVGSTRFNQLRRGVPRMSPALISKRLKELEDAGIIKRERVSSHPDVFDYTLTESGQELRPVIESIGVWGHRWIETRASLDNLDPNLLMWDIRRHIDPTPIPPTRKVIQVIFSDQPAKTKNWWLVVKADAEVDLCSVEPGFDVDLYLVTDLRKMTEIWMGYTSVKQAVADETMIITGEQQLQESLQTWFKLSPFAEFERRVA